MKKLAKILSAGLSALMLMSVPGITAGAVSENSCGTDIIAALSGNCSSQCGGIQSVLGCLPGGCSNSCSNGQLSPGQLFGGCDIDSLIGLLQQRGNCPGGDCTAVPSQNTTGSGTETAPAKPSETPQAPAETPQAPAEKPETPAVKPAAPSAAPSADSGFNTAYEDEVIRLVNIERAKYGLTALKKDTGASSVARVRAKEIVQSFSHTRPDGTSCFTAAKEQGVSYSAAGENIAYGYADPQKVVTGWMNSEGHRKNILSSSFSKIGVGCYSSGNVLYWSQFFIG